jgi:hypothetical protein
MDAVSKRQGRVCRWHQKIHTDKPSACVTLIPKASFQRCQPWEGNMVQLPELLSILDRVDSELTKAIMVIMANRGKGMVAEEADKLVAIRNSVHEEKMRFANMDFAF